MSSATCVRRTVQAPPCPDVSFDAPVLSEFRVDRVAGLSVADLDLDADATDALARELDLLDGRLASLGETVSDLLYALVPALGDDTATRRAVLAVRRCCGNRPQAPAPDKAAAAAEALARHAAADEIRLFEQWRSAWDRHKDALTELEAAYERDTARACASLRAALAEGRDSSTAIAQAGPQLGRRLPHADLRPGRRQARTIGGYLTRAARKTSPFSFLTSVGSTTAPSRTTGRETVTVAQEYVMQLLDLLGKDRHVLPAFELEPLWTPGSDPARDTVAVPEVTRYAEFTWRTDHPARLGRMGPVLARLQQLGRRPAHDYLDAIAGDDPFLTVRRLIDLQLLRVVAPWSYGCQGDRLDRLADALDRLGTPHSACLGARVRAVATGTAALAGTRGTARADALVALHDQATRLVAGLGADPADSTFTVHSDTVPAAAVGPLGPSVEGDLCRLGRAIRPLIFRSHAYDAIVEQFVQAFGPSGVCSDVYGFLTAVAARHHDLAAALARDEQARRAPGERVHLPVGRSSAPPTTAVLYQVAASSAQEIRDGRYQLIANQLHAGSGGLISRFHGESGHPGLRTALREWTGAAYPGTRVVEFIASSGVNHMQSACEGTFPRLVWPTAPPVAVDQPDAVPIDELRLRHDAAGDTLELEDAHGTPVAPVYLGLVPAHLLGGADRVLAVLSDPWVNAAATTLRRLPPPPTDDTVRHEPRLQRGRLITRRATWTVRVAHLPRPEESEPDAAYLRRVNAWRRAHGIPDHVFVHRRCAAPSMDAGSRKPFWVSFLSPHTVAQLAATLDQATTALTFTEVAPADRDLWLRQTTGGPLVVEHLTHLRWRRPMARTTAAPGEEV